MSIWSKIAFGFSAVVAIVAAVLVFIFKRDADAIKKAWAEVKVKNEQLKAEKELAKIDVEEKHVEESQAAAEKEIERLDKQLEETKRKETGKDVDSMSLEALAEESKDL